MDTTTRANQNRLFYVPLSENESSCKTFHMEMKKSFCLHGNEPVGGAHFQLNGFARRLILT